jgi:hypothetical protein
MLFAYVAELFGDPYMYTWGLGCVQEGKQGTVKDTLRDGFFDEAKMEHFLSSPLHLCGLVTQEAELACSANPCIFPGNAESPQGIADPPDAHIELQFTAICALS